jgi:DNA-binding GntR family transcriptional regulator
MAPPKLPKLKQKTSISDLEHVYAELKLSIMMGEFVPGQKLKLAELAAAFGTSNMPVREALNRLVVARAIESEPRRSMAIPLADPKRLRNLLSLRTDLEGKAMRLAMRADREALANSLEAINAKMDAEGRKQSPNTRTYLAFNHSFHFEIYRRCRNEDLLSIIELLWMRYGPMLSLLKDIKVPYSSHRHHEEIVDAVRRNDPKKAVASLVADLEEAGKVIAGYLKSDEAVVHSPPVARQRETSRA